jgi:hypothetical protein
MRPSIRLDTMTLPPQIELRARSAEADDLSGIIFRMQITAGYKNPYSIYFPKTGEHRHTRLTAKEIEMQFKDHWDMALMDYNGSLEDANELVTIHLWDPAPLRQGYDKLLAWPLFSYEETRWKSRREWLDYMASCRNDEFSFGGISISLPETTLVYIPLHRAGAHADAKRCANDGSGHDR